MHPPRRRGFPARATAGRGGPSFVKNTNPRAPPYSKNRKSECDGYGIHQHISASKSYAKVKYEMMMELRDEAFYKVVKPHKGRLFGLGTTQMENYDHIAPPAVVLTCQAQSENEVTNLTGMVKLMSQQLTALCEARGVTASDATTNPSPSSPPTTNKRRI